MPESTPIFNYPTAASSTSWALTTEEVRHHKDDFGIKQIGDVSRVVARQVTTSKQTHPQHSALETLLGEPEARKEMMDLEPPEEYPHMEFFQLLSEQELNAEQQKVQNSAGQEAAKLSSSKLVMDLYGKLVQNAAPCHEYMMVKLPLLAKELNRPSKKNKINGKKMGPVRLKGVDKAIKVKGSVLTFFIPTLFSQESWSDQTPILLLPYNPGIIADGVNKRVSQIQKQTDTLTRFLTAHLNDMEQKRSARNRTAQFLSER